MYPPGHPALRPATASAFEPLQEILRERTVLPVAVASRQLEVQGIESDPEHPRYSFLAARLHRHQIAALTFGREIELRELEELLALVGADPDRGERPLGAIPEGERPTWPHIRVQPIRYDKLEMARGRIAATPEAAKERASRLWLGLARAVLLSDAVEEAGRESPDQLEAFGDEEALARAVEEYSAERAHAEEILAHLATISRELKTFEGAEAEALKRRTGHLIGLVRPEALGRVLREGGGPEERRQLLLDASQWMEPDSVLKLLAATAAAERRDLSRWLTLMLTKLAKHTAALSPAIRSEGRATLREQVQALVADWALPEALPASHEEAVERLARGVAGGIRRPVSTVGAEPERVLQIGLEVDRLGPAVWAAVAELLESHRFAELLEILDGAPPESRAAGQLWSAVATPGAVRRLLAERAPDFASLDRLLERLGVRAAGPMLDALSNAESRAVRRQLYSRLAGLGPEIGPHILRHLEDERWYVRRNMLALLGELKSWPPGWFPAPHAGDPHPSVRREALKLMLRVPELRERAVCGLLEDPDPRALALGLGAAQESAPPEAVPLLLAVLEREDARPELRALAIRAAARQGPTEALESLLALVLRPAGWLSRLLGRRRLAEKSPVMLEALAALGRHLRHVPAARQLLEVAAASDDPEIRAAARGEWER